MLFFYGSTGLIINILFNSNNIMTKKQVIDDFYSSLGIAKVKTKDKEHLKNETLYNLYQKPKKEKGENMPHFENNKADQVQQADILYLPDDNGYKYCLVVVDVADHKMDAQQLKEISAKAVLQGFKTIYKRGILSIPNYQIIVDQGSEFKSVVSDFFKQNKVILKRGQTGRHRQVAIVEAFNKIIGKAVHMRQTAEELQTNEPSTEWTEFLPTIVEHMNKKLIRKLEPYKFGDPSSIPIIPWGTKVFKIGDKVRVALDEPRSVAGNTKLHGKFRESDIRWEIKPTTINNILIHEKQPLLYTVDGHKNVGYTKERLQLVNDNEGQAPETLIKKFIPEKLLDKRKEKNKIQYLVKWKGYEKPDWNYLSDLKNKDNKNYIDDLINQYNKK